jgi:AICAR transformylase/IMP cyclohydrolase PurH
MPTASRNVRFQAVARHSGNPVGIAQFGAIQAAYAGEIERAVAAFARSAHGGMIASSRSGDPATGDFGDARGKI